MKTLLAAGALVASLSMATLAQAETIDVSTLKCSDFATMPAEDASYVFIWLHGYFGGEAGDPTINLDDFDSAGKAIGDKCAENPEVGVMTVIRQLSAE